MITAISTYVWDYFLDLYHGLLVDSITFNLEKPQREKYQVITCFYNKETLHNFLLCAFYAICHSSFCVASAVILYSLFTITQGMTFNMATAYMYILP